MAGKLSLRIRSIASVHVFVRDLERSRAFYIDNLGFTETAVSTPAFEAEHCARASVLEAGDARFVFIKPILPGNGEIDRWLQHHPEGVGRIVLQVEDAGSALRILKERGATLMTGLESAELDGVQVRWFDIASPLGDTLFRFLESSYAVPQLPGLVRTNPERDWKSNGVRGIDHVTSNFLTLLPVTRWMEEVLGFERFWEFAFHTDDVVHNRSGGSGLRSVVMWDPESGVKFANNEPAAPHFMSSQIYQFCTDHRGPGVQHVALLVDDLVATVREMRERGVLFMPTPSSYYHTLPARLEALGLGRIDQDLALLHSLEILVDGDGPDRYLLQIFLREASNLFRDPGAGPLFIELIQRRGDRGFGAGNFRALFESVERQQMAALSSIHSEE